MAPGAQTSDDDAGLKSAFAEQMGHPGACALADAGAIHVDFVACGKAPDFLVKVVGFEADGAFDSRGVRIVVAVGARIDYQYLPASSPASLCASSVTEARGTAMKRRSLRQSQMRYPR